VNNEVEQQTHHRRDQGGSRPSATPADPWPETPELPLSKDDGLTGRLWAFGEFPAEEESSAVEFATGFASLGFIRAALRRSRWFWCATAVVGLLLGVAGFKEFPPAYKGSTTILLANNPFEIPSAAILDDQTIAQSRTVAGAALRKLGLHEDPGVFVGHYTVVPVTNRVLVITVKAASGDLALREANALATAYLAFQAKQLQNQELLVNTSLQQQVAQAQQHVNSISTQIKSVRAQRPSPARRAALTRLSAEQNSANSALSVLRLNVEGSQATTRIQTANVIKGSQVLDPAALLPQHKSKYLLLYVGGGLLGGLVLGMLIVIIRALVSDRLRRRDDIAHALGAPVKLSVGKVRLSRWRPGPRGLAAAQSTDIQRIVRYLGRTLPTGSPGVAALAVVPVGDPQVAALSLASLAVSCAQQGFQVALADLYDGSPAARLLGFTGPGAQMVTADGTQLLVAVPDPDDAAPAGPLHQNSRGAEPDGSLAAACGSADILLTLATVGPSLGAEHLSGWTRRAVAVVTAGGPSAARVHAVGELVRLAGIELVSAVLVGADETDESLGMPATPGLPASASRA
jgi:capsular polysaccharide biosynthesis protein